MKNLFFLIVATAIFVTPLLCQSVNLVNNLDLSGINVSDEGFFLGYTFTAQESGIVSALGAYQPNGSWTYFDFNTFEEVTLNLSGNSAPAHVALYDDAGNIMTDAWVSPSCTSDGFGYTSVTPTVLQSGETYHLVLLTGDGVYFGYGPGASLITFSSTFDVNEMRSSNTSATSLPSTLPSNDNSWSFGYVFADFQFDPFIGCIDSMALNYSPDALVDDGSCFLCTQFEVVNTSCNWDYSNSYSEGSVYEAGQLGNDICQFFICVQSTCSSDLDGDGTVSSADLLYFLSEFGASCVD